MMTMSIYFDFCWFTRYNCFELFGKQSLIGQLEKQIFYETWTAYDSWAVGLDKNIIQHSYFLRKQLLCLKVWLSDIYFVLKLIWELRGKRVKNLIDTQQVFFRKN